MKNIMTMTFLLCVGVQIACAQSGRNTDEDSQRLADRIVESEIPVLVDFWAAWCMPCRILDPVIEELKKEYEGRVLFVKVDVDIHRSIARFFRVNSVPSVFIIEDKTVRTMIPGVQSRDAYKRAIEDALRLAASRKQCTQNC
jgi:thioredoxin 1